MEENSAFQGSSIASTYLFVTSALSFSRPIAGLAWGLAQPANDPYQAEAWFRLTQPTAATRSRLQLIETVKPKLAIPIHFDDYDVFKSPLSDFTKAVAGRSGKLRSLFDARRCGQFSVARGGCRYECAAALIRGWRRRGCEISSARLKRIMFKQTIAALAVFLCGQWL